MTTENYSFLEMLRPVNKVCSCPGAHYLLSNKEHLKYGEALLQGFPIGSGVIEGACRHLINDRLDITGARWGLVGAILVFFLE